MSGGEQTVVSRVVSTLMVSVVKHRVLDNGERPRQRPSMDDRYDSSLAESQ